MTQDPTKNPGTGSSLRRLSPEKGACPSPTQAHPSTPKIVSGLGVTADPPCAATTNPSLPQIQLDDHAYRQAQSCVQCGLCLPACPTYTETGLEADSPRGRIRLMKGLADGRIGASQPVVQHLDLCLDCRACETACPSGVQYHELIEQTRATLPHGLPNAAQPQTLADEIVHAMCFDVMPYAHRLKLAMLPARLLQHLGLWRLLTQSKLSSVLPPGLLKLMGMLPTQGPMWEPPLAKHYPAMPLLGCSEKTGTGSLFRFEKGACPGPAPDNSRNPTVAFFAGCIGSALFGQVNRQTIQLLQHAGCDVVVPSTQQCCGAIHHHAGNTDQAKHFALANIDAFENTHHDYPQSDYIVNNIAGCGAMLKDYAHLLRDDGAYADRALAFTSRVRDISELLVQLELPPPSHPHPPARNNVTYHDACHLAHAQGITNPPRQMLDSIPGLNLIPLPESDMCCGAAGTYSLAQPGMATQLGQRKAQHIQQTGATVCATGNIGCAMQIQYEADRLGINLRVVHPVTLLHESYFGPVNPKNTL